MEYPSKNDFYLKFKAIYNREGSFIDYELVYISETFYKAANIIPDRILGRRFSEIVVDYSDQIGFKELYFSMIPKSKFKFELYIKEIERWYLINMFSDKSSQDDLLVIYYVDITYIKQNIQSPYSQSENENNIYDIKDIKKLYYKDRLTGLYNKNFFEEELSRLDTQDSCL